MSPSLTPSDQEAIDRIVSDVLAASGAPGAILGFWRGEDGYTQAYGVADLETGTPPTLHDHVRIASITKTFAGTVLNQTGQAIETIAITMSVHLGRSLGSSMLMNAYNKRVAINAELRAAMTELNKLGRTSKDGD